MKIYYVDASLHRPLDVSTVAYVELINKDKKVELQSKIALDDNGGDGSLFLPASLNSGNYVLRVYTHWMKNFDANFYYEQIIRVINPFTRLSKTDVPSTAKYDVQFFPEGGNLVAGLESVVAFRAVDSHGRGIHFKGAIVDEHNDTLVHFHPLKFGMGRFVFTPGANHSYRAVLTDSLRKRMEYILPPILSEGIVMQVSDTLDQFKVKIKSSTQNAIVHLLAHTRQVLKVTETRILESGNAVVQIPKSSIGEGITHLTLFTDTMVPVCERLVFKRPAQSLRIGLDQQQPNYAVREKVNLNITTQHFGNAVAADMSVAVYKIDSLEMETPSLVDYLWLTSDLKGTIESPAYYLGEKTPEVDKATDNLMLTHGWSRFRWEDVLNEKSKIEYVPEVGGHLLQGKITVTGTGAPAYRVNTYLSVPGKPIRLYVSTSDAHGKLLFELQDFYGTKVLMVQTNQEYDSGYRMELLSPYSTNLSLKALPPFEFPRTLKNSLEQRSIHMQVQRIFYEKENDRYLPLEVDSLAFYGKAPEGYRLDDYTRFPTMEEVMREYVAGVMVRKHKDGFHFMTSDKVSSIFRDDPLVLLDGLPVFDIDRIMEFDPLLVNRLEVVPYKYFLGSAIFNGIVSYSTYKNDLAGFQPHPETLSMKYDGLQVPREFFSPRYETQQQQNSTMPDARTLLYWSPNAQTDSQGKAHLEFFSSDITGKYRVVVQGLTKNGEPGCAVMVFEVKEK